MIYLERGQFDSLKLYKLLFKFLYKGKIHKDIVLGKYSLKWTIFPFKQTLTFIIRMIKP